MAGGVGVTGANEFGLEGFELLEGAELVCHFGMGLEVVDVLVDEADGVV